MITLPSSPTTRALLLALALAGVPHATLAQLKAPAATSGGKPTGGLAAPSAPPAPAAPSAPATPAPAAPAAAPAASPAAAPVADAADTTEMENAGRLAAAGWLALLDRKDWGTAWQGSAGMFRSTVPLPAWMDGIPKVRTPLGAMQEREATETAYRSKLDGRPDGHYVTVLFATKFENKPDAEEVVTTVREPDGRWRVTGYVVR